MASKPAPQKTPFLRFSEPRPLDSLHFPGAVPTRRAGIHACWPPFQVAFG